MSKRAFDKIRAGLDSARTYLNGAGDKKAYRVHGPETLDEMGPGVESVPAKRGPSLEGGRSTMGRPGMHGGFKANKRKR